MSTQTSSHLHMSRHHPVGKQVTVCKLSEATKICFGVSLNKQGRILQVATDGLASLLTMDTNEICHN